MNATKTFLLANLPKTDAAIRAEFPGRGNAGLRKRLRDSAYGGSIGNCRDVALTVWGEASLAEVRRVHREEMQALGLVDAEGYPLFSSAQDPNDPYGRTVFFLDQPTPTFNRNEHYGD